MPRLSCSVGWKPSYWTLSMVPNPSRRPSMWLLVGMLMPCIWLRLAAVEARAEPLGFPW